MLIRADARQIPLVDGCVQCVVTSPPYFGLRDYGTARWEGGNADCQHNARNGDLRFTHPISEKQRSNAGSAGSAGSAGKTCITCGAIRFDHQLGLEPTPAEYISALVDVFHEVRRILRGDGTVWLNLGDSYNAYNGNAGPGSGFSRGAACDTERPHLATGHGLRTTSLKPKDLIGIPWRVAFALQADGWYLRSDIIWAKPNPMPESVTDRPTKAHEYLFLLTKSERYWYDAAAIREPYAASTLTHAGFNDRWDAMPKDEQQQNGANKRTVWTIPTMPYAGAHFATMPEALVEPCILAGCPLGGLVFDPFVGSGTVIAVANRLGRRAVGTDLAYQDLAAERTAQRGLMFGETVA